VVVAFDCAGPTFRDGLYDAYKSQRGAPPEALGPQFDLAYEACRAFGWPAVAAPGYEADDVIATLAAAACRGVGTGGDGSNGSNGSDGSGGGGGGNGMGAERGVVIVAQDKDFMQLVTDRCVMVDPAKKRLFGCAEVEEKFGVPPRLMADLQALTGDATDNVPGVPGIGPKIAAELLGDWGSLDNVLDAARATDPANPKKPAIKQTKRRENLVAHRGDAELSRRLVTLDAAVPLDRMRLLLAADGDGHGNANANANGGEGGGAAGEAGGEEEAGELDHQSVPIGNEARLAALLAPAPRPRSEAGADGDGDPARLPLQSAVAFCQKHDMRALERTVRLKAAGGVYGS
jgi:hypothetical protein